MTLACFPWHSIFRSSSERKWKRIVRLHQTEIFQLGDLCPRRPFPLRSKQLLTSSTHPHGGDVTNQGNSKPMQPCPVFGSSSCVGDHQSMLLWVPALRFSCTSPQSESFEAWVQERERSWKPFCLARVRARERRKIIWSGQFLMGSHSERWGERKGLIWAP